MNELVSAPTSPWYTIPASVGLLALTFVFAPGVLLHIGVMLYPKGHDRRQEFTAELYTVPYIKRPFWVAGVLVRCVFEGTAARRAARRKIGFGRQLMLLKNSLSVAVAGLMSAWAIYQTPWLVVAVVGIFTTLLILLARVSFRRPRKEKDS